MKRNFPKNEEHEEAFVEEKRILIANVLKMLEKEIKRLKRKEMIFKYVIAPLSVLAFIAFWVYLNFLLCNY